ncbi:peroxiredoxin-4-like [Diorhabda carinulata]|uniref:peroxiredoxin-4-like n=1 Tax=Diorhabda carinulata TaxID=1163345 RepID=UPI0025A1DABB|nr:peroxiredoxin-4-like [Diorhabda carinulata]
MTDDYYYSKVFITKPAPYWEGQATLHDEFITLKLSDFRGKYLILFFYPLDFTFVCPTEIIAFNKKLEDFKNINTEIVGCSVDSHYTHLAWMNTPVVDGGLGKIDFPLLSDITHKISQDYGVYLDTLGHTLRGLFIIDKRGIVRQITINDVSVGRNVEEIIRLVQAFQFTDDNHDVCPANWKPGDATVSNKPKKKFLDTV